MRRVTVIVIEHDDEEMVSLYGRPKGARGRKTPIFDMIPISRAQYYIELGYVPQFNRGNYIDLEIRIRDERR